MVLRFTLGIFVVFSSVLALAAGDQYCPLAMAELSGLIGEIGRLEAGNGNPVLLSQLRRELEIRKRELKLTDADLARLGEESQNIDLEDRLRKIQDTKKEQDVLRIDHLPLRKVAILASPRMGKITSSARLSKGGKTVAAVLNLRELVIWDSQTGDKVLHRELPKEKKSVLQFGIDESQNLVRILSNDGEILELSLANPTGRFVHRGFLNFVEKEADGEPHPSTNITFSDRLDYVIVGGKKTAIFPINNKSKIKSILTLDNPHFGDGIFHNQDSNRVVVSSSNYLKVIDVNTKTIRTEILVPEFGGEGYDIGEPSVSADGKYLATIVRSRPYYLNAQYSINAKMYKVKNGFVNLIIMNLETGKIEDIRELEDNDQLYFHRFDSKLDILVLTNKMMGTEFLTLEEPNRGERWPIASGRIVAFDWAKKILILCGGDLGKDERSMRSYVGALWADEGTKSIGSGYLTDYSDGNTVVTSGNGAIILYNRTLEPQN